MPNYWQNAKRVLLAQGNIGCRGLRSYNKYLGINLLKQVTRAYSEWERRGRPGGVFRILEIGAGEGVVAKKIDSLLKKRNAAFEIIPLNLSVEDFNGTRVGSAVTADCLSLPFRNDSINFVISVGTAPYIRDRPWLLREVNRVLSPIGGEAHVNLFRHSQKETDLVYEEDGPKPLAKWLGRRGFKTRKHSVSFQKMKETPLPTAVSISTVFHRGVPLPKVNYVSLHR
ncbi:MAG: class I SAM-dependent methyltransferase [Candidatus Micrarchaeota archaeon]